MPAAALLRLREQIGVEMTYHSNAIEGNTLTLQETRLILETGITIGGKSLREHFEVINHQEALTYVEDLISSTEAITPFHVRQIHRLVLTRIDDETAGQYRTLPYASPAPATNRRTPGKFHFKWPNGATGSRGRH